VQVLLFLPVRPSFLPGAFLGVATSAASPEPQKGGPTRPSEHAAKGQIERADAEEHDEEDAARTHVADRFEEHLLPNVDIEVDRLPVKRVADAKTMGTRLKFVGDRVSPEQGGNADPVNPDDELPRFEVVLRGARDGNGRWKDLFERGEVVNRVVNQDGHAGKITPIEADRSSGVRADFLSRRRNAGKLSREGRAGVAARRKRIANL